MPRPRQTTKKRPKRKHSDPNLCEITQVAHIINWPYQRTRNAMLGGLFGPSQYNEKARKLTVLKVNVLRWKAARDSGTSGMVPA
jgi:hypothetical protein